MLAGHGCNLLTAAVCVGLAMTGSGCQSTGLFANWRNQAADAPVVASTAPPTSAPAAAPASPGVFSRLMGVIRPNREAEAPPAGWRAAYREPTAARQVVAASGWRPVVREQAPAREVVPVGGWQPNPALSELRAKIFPGRSQDVQTAAVPVIETSQSVEPPVLSTPQTLPVEAGHPVVEGMPHPAVPAPHGPAPAELNKVLLPPYIIEPPDILLVETLAGISEVKQPIRGQHLVRPDGTISLGVFGSVRVAGLTIEQARTAVANTLTAYVRARKADATAIKVEDVNVDVIAYNSKVYYIITDGGGYGEQVVRAPFTGNETVLDALSLINGLPAVASKKNIWIARRVPGCGGNYNNILPVDWCAITQGGAAGTNYQLFPGDRIYVKAQGIIRFDNNLGKVLSPIERLFGTTLLGSETVNSIQGRGAFGGSGTTGR